MLVPKMSSSKSDKRLRGRLSLDGKKKYSRSVIGDCLVCASIFSTSSTRSPSSSSSSSSSSSCPAPHTDIVKRGLAGAESLLESDGASFVLLARVALRAMLLVRLLCILLSLVSQLHRLLLRMPVRLLHWPVLTEVALLRLLARWGAKESKLLARLLSPQVLAKLLVHASVHSSATVCQSMAFLSLISFSY